MAPARPTQPNQSVERAIECLLALAAAESPVRLSDLARDLGLERTRVSRTLGTLAHLGLAERRADLRYVPGPGIHVLSAMSLRRSALLTGTLPYLEELRSDWRLAPALGVLWRTHVVYLYHSSGKDDLAGALTGHRLFPATASSIGQVLLAQKGETELRALLRDAGGLDPALHATLSRIREEGLHESSSHMTVPLGNPPVAGLAVNGRITAPLRPKLRQRLREVQDAFDSTTIPSQAGESP